MALKQTNSTRRSAVETNGPVMADNPSGPNPPNPSDEIFAGRAIPIVLPRDQVTRRAFQVPIVPPLHYREGPDGAAETVSSRFRPSCDLDGDQSELGINLGPNKVQAGNGVDINEFTLRGEWIRGS